MTSQVSSVAISKVSSAVTKSHVSMVDFKFQCNAIKNKLKQLLKSVDSEKTGYVKYEVFFELLELHQINLKSEAKSYLKKKYSKNQTINYKDAVNQLTIDLSAAGGDENAENAKLRWTVFALETQEQQVSNNIGDDSVSQMGGNRFKSVFDQQKSEHGQSFLSKDKLGNLQKDYESQKNGNQQDQMSKIGSLVSLGAVSKQSTNKTKMTNK